MKKIFLILAVVFAGITTAVAGNGDKNITQVIKNNLSIPSNLKATKLNEKVNVQFKIDENGKAQVIEVNTSNQELKNHVILQIEKILFDNSSQKISGTYFVDINFKVL